MSTKFASPSAVQTAIGGVVALLLLVSGAVAVERFGGSETAVTDRSESVAQPKAFAPAPTPPGPPDTEVPIVERFAPAPTGPAPVPARTARPASADVQSVPEPTAVPEGGGAAPPAGEPAGAGAAPSPERGAGSEPGLPQPAPAPPEPAPLLVAGASVGEGATGAVAHTAVPEGASPGSAPPDLDVTVSTVQVIGDAPPARGTSVELGGSLLPGDVGGPALFA